MSKTKRDEDVVTVFVHSATGHSETYERRVPREPRPAKLWLQIAGVQICEPGEIVPKEEMRRRFDKAREALWKKLEDEGVWPPREETMSERLDRIGKELDRRLMDTLEACNRLSEKQGILPPENPKRN